LFLGNVEASLEAAGWAWNSGTREWFDVNPLLLVDHREPCAVARRVAISLSVLLLEFGSARVETVKASRLATDRTATS
jgi:hypothetical protein